ncbi:MAG: hypothetical protein WC756_04935 [Taibaiella sp.]|jgi:hypothetical protein
MNSYFMVRIELNNLDKKNTKLEYRALYDAMNKQGFTESFFDNDNRELLLPKGMYAIMKFDFTENDIVLKVEKAIEIALTKYYGAKWENKFTAVISGPSSILSRNLESVD